MSYGTNVAGGVTPGKGGQTVEGVPVFDSVSEAVRSTGATSSILFVPAPAFYAAAEEAILAGVKLLVAIQNTFQYVIQSICWHSLARTT